MSSDSCALNLVNGTKSLWIGSNPTSKGVTWNVPKNVDAGAQQLFTIEVEDVSSDTMGDVTYSGDVMRFTIQLRVVNGKVVLQVDWQGSEIEHVVFPPAIVADSAPSVIGWSSGGGTVSLGVFDPQGVPTPLPYVPVSEASWTEDWMSFYGTYLAGTNGPYPSGMSLCDLTLPGTHDSGTYDLIVKSEFGICQDLDFTGQLKKGVRYFDMRVGYDQDGQFIMCHDALAAHTTLADAVCQITSYLSPSHPGEIIILDFHRFTDFRQFPPEYDQEDFPYSELFDAIVQGQDGLQTFWYPLDSQASCAVTLADIYAQKTARVLVSMNTSYFQDPRLLPPITQKWQGSNPLDNTPTGLKTYIDTVMTDLPANQIWAMMAAINFFPTTPPQPLSPDIDNWFYGGSEDSMKCNAIPTDYIEKTALVANSVCSTLLKARMGPPSGATRS